MREPFVEVEVGGFGFVHLANSSVTNVKYTLSKIQIQIQIQIPPCHLANSSVTKAKYTLSKIQIEHTT